MRRTFVLLSLFWAAAAGLARPNATVALESSPVWVRPIGGPGWDKGTFGVQARDDGATVVGGTEGFTAPNGQVVPEGAFVTWYNSRGKFEKVVSLPKFDPRQGRAAFRDDGSILLLTLVRTPAPTVYLVELAPDGNEVGRRPVAGPPDGDHTDDPASVATGRDGSVLVAWTSSGRTRGRNGAFLARYRSDGRLAWRAKQRLGLFGTPGVALDSRGRAYGASGGTIEAYSRDGRMRWRHEEPRASFAFFISVVVAPDGLVCAIGATGTGPDDLDTWLQCYSVGGRLRFERRLGGPGIDLGTGIAFDPRGGILVTGATASARFARRPVEGAYDAFFARLDRRGLVRRLGVISGDDNDVLGWLSRAPGGAVYSLGITESREFGGALTGGDGDLALVRLE